MSLMISFHFLIALCISVADIATLMKGKGEGVITHADGVEFNSISRGTLLQLLAAFEENIRARLSGQKAKPVFTAEFANNLYTRPFIYPRMDRVLQACTYPDPGFWTKTSLIQFGYGVWVNLTNVATGLTLGFSAVALPQITKPDSNITTTVSDQSWITSVLTLSCPIGCIITGYLIDKLGRRIMLITCHAPLIVGWVYTALATTAKELIIGRIITGVALGALTVVPRPYLSEIALPNMRGVIGTFPNLAMSTGVVILAGLGPFYSWQTICYISSLFSLILMVCNYFLPETPYFLLMNETIERAEAALRKFRSANYNIEAEMEELKDFKVENNIHKFTWKQNFVALFKRASCKPFCLMMAYCMFAYLSGIYVVIMWTVEILGRSKSSVDPHAGNFLLGITRLVSAVFMSIIIFQLGRRPLALTSGLGVGIVSIGLGIYILYIEEITIIPQICYMAYIVFGTLGHYTLPVLIMSELYPLQVRGMLGGLSTSMISLLIFAVNALYPYMIIYLGFPYTIVTFGVFSLLGTIFLYFFLPETKDLTLQEIEEFYNERRPTLTSQRRIVSMMQLSRGRLSLSDASKSLIRITDKHKKGDMKLVKTKSEDSQDKKDDESTSRNLFDKKEG